MNIIREVICGNFNGTLFRYEVQVRKLESERVQVRNSVENR